MRVNECAPNSQRKWFGVPVSSNCQHPVLQEIRLGMKMGLIDGAEQEKSVQ
jgi:hypothetical protein